MTTKMFFYVAVFAIVATISAVLGDDDHASGPAPGPTGDSSSGTSIIAGVPGSLVGGFVLSFLTFFLQ